MKRSGILGSSWPYTSLISGPLLFACEDFQAWLDQVDDEYNIQIYRYTDIQIYRCVGCVSRLSGIRRGTRILSQPPGGYFIDATRRVPGPPPDAT